MFDSNTIRVKICCISSLREAQLAIKYGASALGLVSKMPSGPGVVSDDIIKSVANSAPPPVIPVLLTSELEAGAIINQVTSLGVTTLQLVDYVDHSVYKELKTIPGLKIIQVIHVTDESILELVANMPGEVDALLLDSGNPALKVKTLGGTGKTHNWAISRKIVETSDKPVFLAGGLNPQNVAEAIEQVRPYGLDICSGVRTSGKLDEVKLKAFFEVVNR